MTSSTDDGLVAEALRLAEAATPGPWRYDAGKQWFVDLDKLRAALAGVPQSGGLEFVGAGPLVNGRSSLGVATTGEADDPQAMADAEFIAAARSLVPALVARLVAAEAALAASLLVNEQLLAGNVDPVDIIHAIAKECLPTRAALATANTVISEQSHLLADAIGDRCDAQAQLADANKRIGEMEAIPEIDRRLRARHETDDARIEEMTADQPVIRADERTRTQDMLDWEFSCIDQAPDGHRLCVEYGQERGTHFAVNQPRTLRQIIESHDRIWPRESASSRRCRVCLFAWPS